MHRKDTPQHRALLARAQVRNRVKRGALTRPHTCELCGLDVALYNRLRGDALPPARIEAHHWNGYDHPLDVWWVCHQCNMKLHAHDGSLTLERAREWYAIERVADTAAFVAAQLEARSGHLDAAAHCTLVSAVFGE